MTVLLATPTFLHLYMRRCTPAQFGSIRLVLAGAEKLPDSMASGLRGHVRHPPDGRLRLTECSPVVAVNTFDWREPGFFQPGSRRGYVGQPLPGVSVRIVSTRRRATRPRHAGLVLVKGPNVMQGYLGRDDLTKAAFHDGWYMTRRPGLLERRRFLEDHRPAVAILQDRRRDGAARSLIEESLNEAVGAEGQVFAVTAVGDESKGEKLVVLHTLDERRSTKRSRLGDMGCRTCSSPDAKTSSRSTRSRCSAAASST